MLDKSNRLVCFRPKDFRRHGPISYGGLSSRKQEALFGISTNKAASVFDLEVF